MHTITAPCDHHFNAINDARDLDLDWHAESRVNDGIDIVIRHGIIQAWFTAGSGLTYHVTFYEAGNWASERPEALNARQRRVLDRIAPALGAAQVSVGKTPHHLIIELAGFHDKVTRRMIADRLALDSVVDADRKSWHYLDGVSSPGKVSISYACSSNIRHGA